MNTPARAGTGPGAGLKDGGRAENEGGGESGSDGGAKSGVAVKTQREKPHQGPGELCVGLCTHGFVACCLVLCSCGG